MEEVAFWIACWRDK